MDDLSLPNMDGMWADDLRKLSAVLQDAAQYAALKAEAMERRSAGEIQAAYLLECRCDTLYARLPESVRW